MGWTYKTDAQGNRILVPDTSVSMFEGVPGVKRADVEGLDYPSATQSAFYDKALAPVELDSDFLKAFGLDTVQTKVNPVGADATVQPVATTTVPTVQQSSFVDMPTVNGVTGPYSDAYIQQGNTTTSGTNFAYDPTTNSWTNQVNTGTVGGIDISNYLNQSGTAASGINLDSYSVGDTIAYGDSGYSGLVTVGPDGTKMITPVKDQGWAEQNAGAINLGMGVLGLGLGALSYMDQKDYYGAAISEINQRIALNEEAAENKKAMASGLASVSKNMAT